jgi:hypothetical protein
MDEIHLHVGRVEPKCERHFGSFARNLPKKEHVKAQSNSIIGFVCKKTAAYGFISKPHRNILIDEEGRFSWRED